MKKFRRPDKSGEARRPQAGRSFKTPPGRCVVGIHAVRELLKVRARAVDELWIRERHLDHPDLVELVEKAQRANVRVLPQAVGLLDRVVSHHQGILAFTREKPELDFGKIENAERSVLIALDEVEDPHNLGAIMRTAWLFSADGVLVPELRSASLTPAVSKVAQGAAEHVPLAQEGNLPRQLERLKEHGFWILGLSHKAKQGLFTLEIPNKVVWVLGSESSGLRKSVENMCDDLIAIPQSNPEASYNVSVAAAVAMAESFRQLRASTK